MIADCYLVATIDEAGVANNSPLTYLDIPRIKDSDARMESAFFAQSDADNFPDKIADDMGRDISSAMEEHETKVEKIAFEAFEYFIYTLIPGQIFTMFVLQRKVHSLIVPQVFYKLQKWMGALPISSLTLTTSELLESFIYQNPNCL